MSPEHAGAPSQPLDRDPGETSAPKVPLTGLQFLPLLTPALGRALMFVYCVGVTGMSVPANASARQPIAV